ncbi:MAG TPA: peptidoglycan DD-metalloendopeptidase family protein [Limnochordales bacterium]
MGRRLLRALAAALAAVVGLGSGVGVGLLGANRHPAQASTPAVLQAQAEELPSWVQPLLKGPAPRLYQKGPRVLAMQRLLHAQGYTVPLDARFQTSTRRALQAFQRRVGLPADGTVGPQTVQALVRWSWWYPVRPGDTLAEIARLYDTNVATLRRLNGLSGSLLVPGTRLLVPRAGTGGSDQQWGRYVARPGDTLWSIARRFAVDVEDLRRFNGLVQPESLVAGQMLWLPLPVPAPARRPAAPQQPARQPSRARQERSALLAWPVRGEVTSGFGWRDSPFGGDREFHEGIDIAVPPGTPVRAAADGVVVQAGWMGSFGYGVVLRHAGGMETLYGHNRRVNVRPGQTVRRGQVIAYSGSTGRSTGPHLDFRVRVNGRTVDPLTLLAP